MFYLYNITCINHIYQIDDSHLYITQMNQRFSTCMFYFFPISHYLEESLLRITQMNQLFNTCMFYQFPILHVSRKYITQMNLSSYHIDESTVFNIDVLYVSNITCINEIYYLDKSILRITQMNQRFYTCMFYLFSTSHVSMIYIAYMTTYPYHIDESTKFYLYVTYNNFYPYH